MLSFDDDVCVVTHDVGDEGENGTRQEAGGAEEGGGNES